MIKTITQEVRNTSSNIMETEILNIYETNYNRAGQRQFPYLKYEEILNIIEINNNLVG